MTTVLSYQPGQTVTIVQQTLNADGYRQDGYSWASSGPNGAPVIARLILPGFTLATGYPVAMNQLDTGLYAYSFQLPTGAVSVGTYIVDIFWYDPTTTFLRQEFVLVNVTAPFGVYGVTSFIPPGTL